MSTRTKFLTTWPKPVVFVGKDTVGNRVEKLLSSKRFFISLPTGMVLLVLCSGSLDVTSSALSKLFPGAL